MRLATDSHGDVYLANYEKQLIWVFSPEDIKIAEFEVKFKNGPCNLALDSTTGALYVAEWVDRSEYKPSVFLRHRAPNTRLKKQPATKE